MSSSSDGFANVYWLGGGSGAGKTTIARILAGRHDLHVYDTDAKMREHSALTTPEESPKLKAFQNMTMDERWILRSPERMKESFHWFDGEGFRFILDDLRELSDRPVVAEGFRLLPRLVRPWLVDTRRAAWLVPTQRFRRETFAARGVSRIIGETTNPSEALDKLLSRDALFTEDVLQECRRLRLQTVTMEPGVPPGVSAERVATLFGLGG